MWPVYSGTKSWCSRTGRGSPAPITTLSGLWTRLLGSEREGAQKKGERWQRQECWEMACTHMCACYTGAGASHPVMVREAMIHSSCGDVGSSVSVANSSPLAQRSCKYELFLWVSQHQLRLILNTSGQAKHICRPELAHRSGSQTLFSPVKRSP